MTAPWLSEPDRLDITDGPFPCFVRRMEPGHLCGYIAVPPGHPWHGRDIFEVDASVHGGLTFSGHLDGAPAGWHVLGFDCGHAGDLIPNTVALLQQAGGEVLGVYRDLSYVRAQLERLVQQALVAQQLPPRVCNGGPNGSAWCGEPAAFVARREDGLEWFCCSEHHEGAGDRPNTRRVPIPSRSGG